MRRGRRGGTALPGGLGRRLASARDRARVSRLARSVKANNLTYLTWQRLFQLERAVDGAARVPGDFIECGVALGGSTVVIASRLPPGRRLHAYDAFGAAPPPTEKDGDDSRRRQQVIAAGASEGIAGDTYYGYVPDRKQRVHETLRRFGVADRVVLHEGLFADTFLPAAPVAFAHVDCDWYEPVKLCLARLHPLLLPGGYVVCDDYHDYAGARAAIDEFLREVGDVAVADDLASGHAADAGSLVLRRRG